MTNVNGLPWIEKYRPKQIDDIVDHDDKIKTLKDMVSNNELTHLLFSGPPGTGKTSLIHTLARLIYGDTYKNYILDINGSSERGIDTIRNLVTQFIRKQSNKVKLVILDEAEALTTEAQNALKSVIEKYSNLARFCLICNDSNKIIPALHSRCTKLIFSHLSKESIKKRLYEIIRTEHMKITKSAVDSLLEIEHDFRQILNIMQSMNSYYDKTIKSSDIYEYLGKPTDEDVDLVIKYLFNESMVQSNTLLNDLLKSGRVNLIDLVKVICQRSVELDIPVEQKSFILTTLSDIEYKTLQGCNQDILVYLLISTFLKIRNNIKKTEN